MDIYKAKYEAVLLAIDDPKIIENAEKLVQATLEICNVQLSPFWQTFEAMCKFVQNQQTAISIAEQPKTDKKVSFGSWWSRWGKILNTWDAYSIAEFAWNDAIETGE